MALKDFYSKLSAQEKMILYVTLGFILAAVFDFLFFQPVSFKLAAIKKDIEQTKDDIKRDVRYLAYKDKILKENEIYQIYKPDEAKTDDQVFSAFLGTVENFARDVDVNPGKISPGDILHKKGYTQYFANIECSGKFENIIKLIHKIDTTSNLLKVAKINIVGKKSSADEVTVIMRISKLIIDTKSTEGEAVAVGAADMMTASTTGSEGAPTINSTGGSGNLSTGVPSADGLAAPSGSKGAKEGGLNGGSSAQKNSPQGSFGNGRTGEGSVAPDNGPQSSSGNGGAVGSGAAQESGPAGSGGGGGNGPNAGESGATAGEGQGPGETKGAGSPSDPMKKQDTAKNQPNIQAKKTTPLNDVSTGERLKVKKSVEELWNDFWGIKPKIKEEKPKAVNKKVKDKAFNHDEHKTEDELKPNLFERMLDKK